MAKQKTTINARNIRSANVTRTKWLNRISAEVEAGLSADSAPTVQAVEKIKGRYDQLRVADQNAMTVIERLMFSGVGDRMVQLMQRWAIQFKLDPLDDELPRLLVAAARAAAADAPQDDAGELLTIDACASRADMSVKTIRRAIKYKKLPALKIARAWRIRENDLLRWMNQGGRTA